MRIIRNLLKGYGVPDIKPLLHGSMVKKADDIRLAVRGVITEKQKNKMNVILSHYYGVKKCKAELESIILSLAEPYARELGLVSNVPGISNPFSTIAIIPGIGADMSVFKTAKHLCLGLALSLKTTRELGQETF